MGEAEQVREIVSSLSLSFSEVIILSKSVISFACLPVFPPPRPVERWRDSPLIQDAQFSGPK